MPKQSKKTKGKKIEKKKAIKRPRLSSWQTTDEQEIILRRERATKEPMTLKKLDDLHAVYGSYQVERKSVEEEATHPYVVELRNVRRLVNTCDCPDFFKSALGTCKHIEKVILSRGRKGRKMTSPFIEVFVEYIDGVGTPLVLLPENPSRNAKLILKPYVDESGRFKSASGATLAVFLRRLEVLSPDKRAEFRVSREIVTRNRLYELSRRNRLIQEDFEKSFNNKTFLRYPLYDYQIEGMTHLAFKGRALLTDEMGLGKTVQAIGAAKILQQTHDVKRVLIVCPASLKTEWEEQIRKFTDLSIDLVYGSRKDRLSLYAQSQTFFVISNYEQIIRDYDEINRDLRPDLVILDEAQRIKNWKTKTAQTIKRLESRFAFVLTGTPLENRIDEVYSLTEFVDNQLLGSLFRFNREFYQFDDNGKMHGLKNLRKLNKTLKSVMLRRRKDEIEEQLPDRIDNNYFVSMTAEQRTRYEEYEYQVALLSRIAQSRPLRPDEFERLQLCLNCMRMLCDTVYILDQKVRDCPKVNELENILNDIWSDQPDRKIIIFSEWVRMLELVRERLDANGVESCLHIGSVPQKKRRDEINRFKNDPTCKVFLSSDSGSVGLNLQAASVVVNMDLPWNPAKLEQRIARAWRKHQKNAVNVINLVSDDTIEHRMLSTLSFKQGLSDAVLDGRGNIEDFEKPNARKAFMERLSQILKADFVKTPDATEPDATPVMPPADVFKDEVTVDDSADLAVCTIQRSKDSQTVESVFAVSAEPEKTKNELSKTLARTQNEAITDSLTVLSLDQYKLLQELAAKGLITMNDAAFEDLIRKDVAIPQKPDTRTERAKIAAKLLKSVERQVQMATLLNSGGFSQEAMAIAKPVTVATLKALYVLADDAALPLTGDALDASMLDAIKATGWLSNEQFDGAVNPTESSDDSAETTCQRLLELPQIAETQRLQLLM